MKVPFYYKSSAVVQGVGIMFDSLLSPIITTEPVDVMHLHMVYEMYVLTEGSAEVSTDTQTIRLNKGEIALVSPQVYHSIHRISDEVQLFSLGFQLFQTEDPKDPKSQIFHTLLTYLEQQSLVALGAVREIFWILEQIRQQDLSQLGAADLVNSYAAMILIYLFRSLSVSHQHTLPVFDAVPDQSPRSIDMDRWAAIEQYIASNYISPNISDLADIMAISEQHLRRFLQSSYAMTFSQLVNHHRINISKRLLSNSELSVYEIAEMVGFRSFQNFSVSFKKITGLSASEYRAQSRKNQT